MARFSITSSVSFTSSIGVWKTAKIISIHRYFSEVSILPLEILLPCLWETGTYMFSLVNCWPREGGWAMDEAFRDQKWGHKPELNSPECWPEIRILSPCQISNRRKAILIECYSLSLSSKLDGSVLLIIADFLEIWGYYSAGRRCGQKRVCSC